MAECLKTKFGSEKDALFYIDKLQKTSKRDKKPIRAYKCWCGSWHLSSKRSFTEMEQTIAEMQKKIDELNATCESLNKENQTLHDEEEKKNRISIQTLVKKDETVVRLQNKLSQQGILISKLRKENGKLNNEIVALIRKNNNTKQ